MHISNVARTFIVLSATKLKRKTFKKMELSTLNIAKERIASGAKFNGTVYVQGGNKNNNIIFIYLDGEYFKLEAWVNVKDAQTVKAQYELELSKKSVITAKEETKVDATTQKNNEWLVNEKKVNNSLSYGEMWNIYGTDFE